MNAAIHLPEPHLAAQGTLAARDVDLCYGNTTVLHGVSLRAHPGRMLALVGPNGAGKSSLLTLLAGLHHPSRGQVTLDGRALSDWPVTTLARRRAMLSQKVQLGFAFRVEEVVLLGRSPHGGQAWAGRDQRIAHAALQAVQANHLLGRNYLELSGGEQQRVQLARVLAQVWEREDAPCWLLLDEPEASLDIAHQHYVLGHARKLTRHGYGVIAVLHDLNLAARYADDVAVMAQGRLQAHGNPMQALDPGLLSTLYGLPLRRVSTDDGRWLIAPAG